MSAHARKGQDGGTGWLPGRLRLRLGLVDGDVVAGFLLAAGNTIGLALTLVSVTGPHHAQAATPSGPVYAAPDIPSAEEQPHYAADATATAREQDPIRVSDPAARASRCGRTSLSATSPLPCGSETSTVLVAAPPGGPSLQGLPRPRS